MPTQKADILKLHLGCFNKKIPGYVNVDIRPDVKPDVVDDILSLDSFKCDTADVIYACHVLEHLSKRDVYKTLKRWREVLKDDGILRIAVPDIEAACEYYVEHRNLLPLQAIFWGSQLHDYDFHYVGWDFKNLKNDLQLNGFYKVKRYDHRTTDHAFIDDYSAAYLPDFDPKGRLMSLNVECRKNPGVQS